jgi:hypothetical protein
VGADIELVRKGLGSDARIGTKFLYAGAGYGGSCFPKDLRAVINTAKEAGMSLQVLTAVEAVNQQQKHHMTERLRNHFGGDLGGRKIAVWGLAFKPGTDDVREAPALVLIEDLLAAGARVSATDPVAIPPARKILGERVEFPASNYQCAEGADALALVTEWHDYRRPNFERLRSLMRTPVVVDGRNAWEPSEVRAAGFTYYGVGRGIGGLGAVPDSPRGKGALGKSSARLLRACAGTPPLGTEVNGRAVCVHDFLGLRLASARYASGSPAHVRSGALPAARAPSLISAGSPPWPADKLAVLLAESSKTR